MKTLAITGASGFIGRHLVDACRVAGDVRLQLLSRRPTQPGMADGVIHCVGDLADAGSLDAFVSTADCVIHLAYLAGGQSANVAAAVNLVAAARRAGVRRIVHCSTAVVVGNATPSPISDDTPARPRGEYQETKLAIERALIAAVAGKIELAILRPTEVFGPGGAGLSEMIRRARDASAASNALRRALFGARRFNYVPVRNVVAALLLLAETPVPQAGNVYNVSDDDDADNAYVAVDDIVREALGKPRASTGAMIPASWLSLAFQLLPGHAPPDRIYTHTGLDRLGYRRATSLRSAILELVTETR